VHGALGSLVGKPLPLELETWVQMIRTFWTLQSKVEHSLKRHNLTLAQFDLLAMLLALEGLNQQELADKLAVTKGNMVGLVNRLSRRGFVKRVPSRNGRRANVIRLTARGRSLVRGALPDHIRLVKTMMSPLAGAEQEHLRTLLNRLDERVVRNAS
jgi:MarR family transcriptional regulator, organic hydroperoxide resistance regulator